MSQPLAFVSIKETCKITSLSRTTIWKLEKEGHFPRTVRLAGIKKGFVRSEVDAWMQARVADRDREAA